MTLRDLVSALALGTLLGGCSSPAPSTSSSSHWVTCKVEGDCSDTPKAAACASGYCVDSAGSRIQQSVTAPSHEVESCDPLTPHELPVVLGTILGVGTDPAGTTYLADNVGTGTSDPDRVFVSEGPTLVRRQLKGDGSSASTGGLNDRSLVFDDRGTDASLLIQSRDGVATAMGLGPPDEKAYIGDPGAVTTVLTVVDASVVSGFILRNLPGDITIAYVADIDDGKVIVVTRPQADYEETSFRVFYGTTSALVERHVTNVVVSQSGSGSFSFQVGNVEFDAHFARVLAPSGDAGVIDRADPGSLDEGNGTSIGLTERWPTPTALAGFTFTCQ